MTYSVKEVFYTLQGEGINAGRPAVFCRFTGCNLWSGLERDRASAVCQFCDTDFVGTNGPGGGKFVTANDLASHVDNFWPNRARDRKFVVCTGGEPALQLDEALIAAFHERGFMVAIETNGTLPLPAGIDWICVSPKVGSDLVVTRGNELKVVVPQEGQDLDALVKLRFDHFLIQAKDDHKRAENEKAAVQICLQRPEWGLSLQTHKFLGIA